VWCPRIPEKKVARLSAKLLPSQALVCKPLHAVLGESEPFVGPGWDFWLILHLLVELLGKSVSALADDETSVLGAVWQQVHETLQTAEARLEGILILVRPWDVFGDIGTARSSLISHDPMSKNVDERLSRDLDLLREAKVHSIERDDKIFGVVNLLKCFDYAWLATNRPRKVFVGHSVLQAHAFLGDTRKLVFVDG
jgi:hypothetical protein